MDKKVQLIDLLKEGKIDEAKALIKELFAADLTPKERGEINAAVLASYIDASNIIDDSYVEYLEATLAELKKINKIEKKVDNVEKTRKVREDLKSS